jgi:Arylsulfotransferase (ASST)
VDVVTSSEAAVAVRCTSATDPTDVHLLEDTGGTVHSFQLGGLLLEDHYDCLAAATCPQAASGPLEFSIDTEAGPAEVGPVDIQTDPLLGMTGAYTLFNLEPCGGDFDWLHIVDPKGRTRWWHAMQKWPNMGLEVRHQGSGLIVWGGGDSNLGRPRQVDLFAGEIYDSAEVLTDWASTVFTHDGKQLEDGRILTLETQPNTFGGSGFTGFAVRLFDPLTGLMSWEYDSQTAVDAGELSAGTAVGDVFHANWADVVVENGVDKLYVSLCFSFQVLKIDPVAGTIEWIFGPNDGDFALQDPAGVPLPDDDLPQCQHGLEVDGDKILMYDNGWFRYESRVTEYQLDTTTMTATRLWTWTDGWYLCCMGDIDYLDNGRVLLTKARYGCGSSTEILEIDPVTGEVPSLVTMRPSDAGYRAERLDGCELFANTAFCPELAARAAELDAVFAP